MPMKISCVTTHMLDRKHGFCPYCGFVRVERFSKELYFSSFSFLASQILPFSVLESWCKSMIKPESLLLGGLDFLVLCFFSFVVFFCWFQGLLFVVWLSWLLASISDTEMLWVLLLLDFGAAGIGLLTDCLEYEGGKTIKGCLPVVELTLDEQCSPLSGKLAWEDTSP
jgi:hypothetical protein